MAARLFPYRLRPVASIGDRGRPRRRIPGKDHRSTRRLAEVEVMRQIPQNRRVLSQCRPRIWTAGVTPNSLGGRLRRHGRKVLSCEHLEKRGSSNSGKSHHETARLRPNDGWPGRSMRNRILKGGRVTEE